MATKQLRQIQPRRTFSEELKLQKVKEIEQNLITIAQLCRDYSVSRNAVYRWIYKYSANLKQGTTQVVQMESEQEKTRKLQERIAELERAVGQKQLKIDFLEKMIELGKEELGVDLQKKSFTPPSTGSGSTRTSTPTK